MVQFADAELDAIVLFPLLARETAKNLIMTGLPLLLPKTGQLFFRCFEFHVPPKHRGQEGEADGG